MFKSFTRVLTGWLLECSTWLLEVTVVFQVIIRVTARWLLQCFRRLLLYSRWSVILLLAIYYCLRWLLGVQGVGGRNAVVSANGHQVVTGDVAGWIQWLFPRSY